MELATQLAEGGRMVFVDNIAQRPGVATGLGRAVVVSKHNGQFATRIEFDASVPVVPGFERKKRFVF